MRVPSAYCLVLLLPLLGACAQSSSDIQATQVEPAPFLRDATVQAPSRAEVPQQQATRSLGQPRLSTLLANPFVERVEPPRAPATPPTATFSQYNGRSPGDAAIPSDVAVNRSLPTELAPFERPPLRNNVPPRAAENVRETRPVPDPAPVRVAEVAPAPRRDLSIQRAPAPTPRPVPGTPTPTLRPIKAVTAPAEVTIATSPPVPAEPAPPAPTLALPPQPTIAALDLPTLSAPSATSDAPPTGLPVFRSVEQAVPLGTLPASLGVANLEAGEAALPAADQLEQSIADESGALSWTQAEALIRAGEVESAVDIGEFEVLLTMCSGRGVLTIQPTPTALADIEMPKVICGKSASLTSQ